MDLTRCYISPTPGAISSAGRAPPRQGGGHWFEPSIAHSERSADAGLSPFCGRQRHGDRSRRYGALMARILTIVTAIAAVLGAGLYVKSSKGNDEDTPAATTTGPAKNAVTLTMVVSPEKEALLKPLVAQFNAAQTDARPAFVQL